MSCDSTHLTVKPGLHAVCMPSRPAKHIAQTLVMAAAAVAMAMAMAVMVTMAVSSRACPSDMWRPTVNQPGRTGRAAVCPDSCTPTGSCWLLWSSIRRAIPSPTEAGLSGLAAGAWPSKPDGPTSISAHPGAPLPPSPAPKVHGRTLETHSPQRQSPPVPRPTAMSSRPGTPGRPTRVPASEGGAARWVRHGPSAETAARPRGYARIHPLVYGMHQATSQVRHSISGQ